MIIAEEKLIQQLHTISPDETVYRFTENRKTVQINKNGLSFFMASKYNPEKEGLIFARETYAPAKTVFLYGLGLGYHVKPLLDLLRQDQTLYIMECDLNLVKLAFAQTDVQAVLRHKQIMFFASDDFNEAIQHLKTVLRGDSLQIILFEPALRMIPESLGPLKDMLESYHYAARSIGKFADGMTENERQNLSQGYENGGKVFGGRFKGLPLIIVCAGPSLAESVEALAGVGRRALLLAVGRVAKYLDTRGVVPDFYIDTESQPIYKRNYEGLQTRKPLFMLSTASARLSLYAGEKYLLFEKNSAAPPDRAYAVESGGSVSTTALSLGVLMGCSPVIFVGQDLCYWGDYTHAAAVQKTYEKVKTARQVTGINGETYYTPTNLYMYLKWIERFISRQTGVHFINATAVGARIQGMEHTGLCEVLADLAPREAIGVYRGDIFQA